MSFTLKTQKLLLLIKDVKWFLVFSLTELFCVLVMNPPWGSAPWGPAPPRCSTHCTPEVSLTHLQNKTTAVQTGASCTYVILSLWIFNEKSLAWHTNSFRKQSRHQGFIITIIIIIISLSSLWFFSRISEFCSASNTWNASVSLNFLTGVWTWSALRN